MIDPKTSSGRSDDSNLELSMAAATAERANKPRWIIILGVVLLVVTGIYTLTQVSARAAMFGKIEGERSSTRKVQDLRTAIENETLALARRGTSPDPRAGQKIEGYAMQAGITLAGAVTDTTRSPNSQIQMQQHVYTAKAVNQDSLALFNWLDAMRMAYDTTGLEMTRMRLTPGGATTAGTAGWNVDVEFARWERLK